jgi:hypothetical protein
MNERRIEQLDADIEALKVVITSTLSVLGSDIHALIELKARAALGVYADGLLDTERSDYYIERLQKTVDLLLTAHLQSKKPD